MKSAYQVAYKWLAANKGTGARGEESNPRKKKEFWKVI